MTPEREQINKVWILKFAGLLPAGSLIYDIGVGAYDYKENLFGKMVKTIDKDSRINPDYVADIEEEFINLPSANGIICIGVTEQCDNPFNIIKGVYNLLLDRGKVFFSILLTGYPLYDIDYLRFTEKGAIRLLDRYFNKIESSVFVREKEPTCLFYIGSKK